MTAYPYIANTDAQWYEFLSRQAASLGPSTSVVPEVNFWFPNSKAPRLTTIAAGTPVFFRRKSPDCAVAGVGFFAAFHMLPLDEAWLAFGLGNGDSDQHRFEARIRAYRTHRSFESALRTPNASALTSPLACMVLRAAEFWPRQRWIPWGVDEGFPPPVVAGKYEDDPARVARLIGAIGVAGEIRDAEFGERFVLPSDDDRAMRQGGIQAVREGQASFRLRLLDAYDGQCAITGEHTTPVLDAAHIHPYLGPRSNHLQNGLVLTKEFHALFDRGYVTVTPDYRVRVSPSLRTDYRNGRRYYPYDGQLLSKLPASNSASPSRDALAWHGQHVFRAG